MNLLKLAYIRGYMIDKLNINNELTDKDLNLLSSSEIDEIEEIGKNNNLKLYYFKEKDNLPRVNIVLGFLKSIYQGI